MKIHFHKTFKKELVLLQKTIQRQTIVRLELFEKDPQHYLLKNHKLSGSMNEFWSINITGDYRALYTMQNEVCLFVRIGTHSQLYKN